MESQNQFSPDDQQVEIPFRQLQPDILRALIEEFVTRDGADWDQNGCSLEDKVVQVMTQLAHAKIRIVHDLRTESTNLIPVDK